MRSLGLALLGFGAVAIATVIACGDDDSASSPNDAGSDSPANPPPPPPPPPPGDAGPDAKNAIDPTTITWQTLPELPTDATRAGSEADIAFDGTDRVLVTFGESADSFAAPHSLSVFRYEGAAWVELGGAPVVSGSAGYVTRPRLAIAKDGTIYLGYNDGTGVVQRFASGAWTPLPPTGLSDVVAITTDATGQPVIAGDVPDGSQVLRFDGAAWGPPTGPLDAGPGLQLGNQALARLADGTIVSMTVDGTNLQAFGLTGTTWAPLGGVFATGSYPSIRTSANGTLGAAWTTDNSDSVRAARFDTASHSFTVLPDPAPAMSRYAVVAMDPYDRPFIAWREIETGIHVAAFTTAWQSLPNPGIGRGTIPALALDSRGLPAVAYEQGDDGGTRERIHVARGVAP